MRGFTFSTVLAFFISTLSVAAQDPGVLRLGSAETKVDLTLQDLDALPQSSFTTSTIWTDDAVEFSGVMLAEVLKEIDANGAEVELVALNDYRVKMPFTVVSETAPLVATRMNGATMAVRDKGPYWIVFPYDSDPEFQTEITYSRSVWQLSAINVLQ